MFEVLNDLLYYLEQIIDILGVFVFEKELFAEDMSFNKYRFGESLSVSDSLLVVGEAQDQEHHGELIIPARLVLHSHHHTNL